MGHPGQPLQPAPGLVPQRQDSAPADATKKAQSITIHSWRPHDKAFLWRGRTCRSPGSEHSRGSPTSRPTGGATAGRKRLSDTGQNYQRKTFIFKFLWRCYKQLRLKKKKKNIKKSQTTSLK